MKDLQVFQAGGKLKKFFNITLFIILNFKEESQIFNQRLNKIQKEKLVNHENDSWDDDLSDNTEITIPSPRPYQYSNNIAKNKMIKRKVARKQSNDLFEENLVDTVKMSREINRDSYLSNSLEQLTLEDRNVNSALNKLTSDSKISFTNENQVKSCNLIYRPLFFSIKLKLL